VGYLNHRPVPGRLDDPTMHPIAIDDGSHLYRACGVLADTVNSHHHQGVWRIADGARVTARSVPDGVAEALEWDNHPFAVGVQWHPEVLEIRKIVDSFVAAAAVRAQDRTPATPC
jgi:putative glutamine amidotransferase